jgi:hypothetical protein
MKNVFAERAKKAYWDLMVDFADSLQATFPDCAETKDWCLYLKNVVLGDEARMADGIEKWCAGMQTPLKKAKYAKAVQSITGSPATVYHAFAYRDMDAADASFEALQSLALPEKVKSMDADTRAVFWQYLDELNKHAVRTPPEVPTSEAIAADIARRRAQSQGGGPVLHHGVAEVWTQLCGCAPSRDDLADVASAKEEEGDEKSIADLCRARDPRGPERLAQHFPELKVPLTDEQWSLLDKALGLACMEHAIPKPMMGAIENVASQLVKDLTSGKADLANLDLEAIGQQVLTKVSPDEMSSFASNLDKILPALQGMQRP